MAETPRPKHIPVRTCVVCREKAGKRTFTRVVHAADGVQLDPSGKMNGRGAYLCEQASCWERAMTGEVLAKALRTPLTEQDRARLRAGRAHLPTRVMQAETDRDMAGSASARPAVSQGKSRP